MPNNFGSAWGRCEEGKACLPSGSIFANLSEEEECLFFEILIWSGVPGDFDGILDLLTTLDPYIKKIT